MVFTLLCSSVMVLVVVFAVIVVIVVEKTLCKYWWYQFSLIWLLKGVLLLNQAISFRHVATALFFNYLTFLLSDGTCNAIICQVQGSTGYKCMYQICFRQRTMYKITAIYYNSLFIWKLSVVTSGSFKVLLKAHAADCPHAELSSSRKWQIAVVT